MLIQYTPVAAASPDSVQLLFYSVRNFRHKKLVEGLVARARPIVRRHDQRRGAVRLGALRGWNGRSRVTRSPVEVASASRAALPKRERRNHQWHQVQFACCWIRMGSQQQIMQTSRGSRSTC